MSNADMLPEYVRIEQHGLERGLIRVTNLTLSPGAQQPMAAVYTQGCIDICCNNICDYISVMGDFHHIYL